MSGGGGGEWKWERRAFHHRCGGEGERRGKRIGWGENALEVGGGIFFEGDVLILV